MKFDGAKLKEARDAMGLSLTELSRSLRVSRGSLCAYENGDSTPNADLLASFSIALDRPISFFYSDVSRINGHKKEAEECA